MLTGIEEQSLARQPRTALKDDGFEAPVPPLKLNDGLLMSRVPSRSSLSLWSTGSAGPRVTKPSRGSIDEAN